MRITATTIGALVALLIHSTGLAGQPFGSHQAEAIVAAPGSSSSVVGTANLRPRSQAASPAIALTAPTGFGASWGDFMLGLGGTYSSGSIDGSGYLGFGLGNAEQFVGLESVMNIISVSDDLFKEDSFSFKLHKTFDDHTAVAIGVEHSLRIGDTTAPDQSYHFLALSHVFYLPLSPQGRWPLFATIGYGDGRFGKVRKGKDKFVDTGVFGALTFVPHPRYSLVAEWLGEELNLGLSFIPVAPWPFTFTVGVLNVAQKNSDSTALGVGAGFVF